jgi:L-alanine-DL-glutamate epimerase-like enolase superfamily enzyme
MELSVHLACAIPNAGKIENIMGVSLFELGAVPTPLPIVNGYLQPPQKPGHGIEIDTGSISAHEVAF